MTTPRMIAAGLAAAALILATPAVALAGSGTGAQYGQHVRDCAHTMVLSGEHNPGMHHGYAGWNGATCDH